MWSFKQIRKPFFYSLFLFSCTIICAQDNLYGLPDAASSENSMLKEFDKEPSFAAFKDNSGLIGTTIGSKPTSTNSDATFQLSVMQRLTNNNLLWDSHLFFQFTMTCFLDVFEPSFPLRDLSINPGIGLNKHLFKDGKYIGQGYLMLEHESNGYDSIQSRSWNKISVAATIQMTKNWEFQAKAWIPIVDGRYSQHILRYQGLFFVASNFNTDNKRMNLSMMFTPTYRKRIGVNSKFELNVKLLNHQPVYAIMQYYNGYGENLLDYDLYKSRLRIGFAFKPNINRF